MRSLQRRPKPRIDVILVIEEEWSRVNPKQHYLNRLADPLGVEYLEL